MLRTVVSTKTLMPFDFLVKNYIDLTHLMAPFVAVAKIKTFEIFFLLCLDTLNLPICTYILFEIVPTFGLQLAKFGVHI